MLKKKFGGRVCHHFGLPPSLPCHCCHQNFQNSKTSLPPPADDIIFEWPLLHTLFGVATDFSVMGHLEIWQKILNLTMNYLGTQFRQQPTINNN